MGVGRGKGGGAGVPSHRASYPSGHWLDSAGNPCRSPSEGLTASSPPTPAKAEKLPNPDPFNYDIQRAEQIGDYLVLKVRYPDCTNYEGVKVLVFKGVTPLDLLKQKSLDPHFFDSPTVASPVARFVPTDDGWTMALRFAKMMGIVTRATRA